MLSCSSFSSIAFPSSALLTATRMIADPTRASGIGVAEVEPARPVVPQHPFHFSKDLDEVRDVQLRAGLEAE